MIISNEIKIDVVHDVEYWEIPHAVDTRYLTHNYFRYIGKIPPQLARELLDRYARPGSLLVDPMCGGGTTLIEASMAGVDAIGYDINPVARLISTVATRKLSNEEVAEVVSYRDNLPPRFGQATLFSLPNLPVSNLGKKPKTLPASEMHKYYPDETWQQLHEVLDDLDHFTLPAARDFCLLALLAILRQVSRANVKKMNVELDHNKTVKPLYPTLYDKLGEMLAIDSQLTHAFKGRVEVRDGMAQEIVLDRAADMVILHPPYLSNTAFSESTLLQLHLLKVDPKAVWKRELKMRGSYQHEPDGLRKYLVGWHRALQRASEILRSGGVCIAIVGDGSVDRVRIPVGVLTIEFAKDLGFDLILNARHVINNNTGQTLTHKMKAQYILGFRKG